MSIILIYRADKELPVINDFRNKGDDRYARRESIHVSPLC